MTGGGAGKEKAMWDQRWGHLIRLGSSEKTLKGCDIKDATRRMQIWQVKGGKYALGWGSSICKPQSWEMRDAERISEFVRESSYGAIPLEAGPGPWSSLSQIGGGRLASRCSQSLTSHCGFPLLFLLLLPFTTIWLLGYRPGLQFELISCLFPANYDLDQGLADCFL